MDELAIRLGIKLVVFCSLFVGLSVGAKALRGRPFSRKEEKGPPDGWFGPPRPDPAPTSPSSGLGEAFALSEVEIDRLCEERARRKEREAQSVARRSVETMPTESKVAEARVTNVKPLAAKLARSAH